MPVRKYFRPVFFCAVYFLAFQPEMKSQEWARNLPVNSNYFQTKAIFDSWYNQQVFLRTGPETGENADYCRFKRWEAFVKPRLDSLGNFPFSAFLNEGLRIRAPQAWQSTGDSANWTLLGPVTIPGLGGGMGRLNVIRFLPGNSQILFAGSANGGLWKSSDAGASWTNMNADHLPSLGVADIAIDPQNTNNIFLATGDGYGYPSGNGPFWGGTYSAGILKSADGGLNWNTTGFNRAQSSKCIVQRLLISPSNPQVLLAAASDGLWRTTDGGGLWTKVMSQHFFDMEFNTSTDTIIYASALHSVYKSTDRGLSWILINNTMSGTTFGRLSLAVTPANPNYIYTLSDTDSLYKSMDGGATFQLMKSPGSMITLYGYYDCVLSVSPLHESTVLIGGMQMVKSTDGGLTWVMQGYWASFPNSDYVHCDNHDLEFGPGSDSTIYSANDGGLFRTTDAGGTWTDLSSGLSISQLYRLGGSATDPGIIYMGQQDNGVVQQNTAAWNNVVGGDGMECVVDYSNSNNAIVSTQNGTMSLTNDGGVTFNPVGPSTAPASWTIPIIQHPALPNIYWAGYDQVYKSLDGGNTWDTISSGLLNPGSTLTVLMAAPSDPSRMYAGTDKELHTTSKGGGSWSSIASGLPLTSNVITALAVSNTDPGRIWVTLSGYSSGIKIYFSADTGHTWVNYSGTLPNIPIDAIVYENGSADRLYIGTDFGVYYRSASMSDWLPFNKGLPNVIVDELEINYKSGKLRAATYGRGLWETPLSELVSVQERTSKEEFSLYPNPSCGQVFIQTNFSGLKRIIVYNALGKVLLTKETDKGGLSENQCVLDLSVYAAGMYFVRLEGERTTGIARVILSK
jgi:photosystem II stability/assembly factor-like uncharacterized protein